MYKMVNRLETGVVLGRRAILLLVTIFFLFASGGQESYVPELTGSAWAFKAVKKQEPLDPNAPKPEFEYLEMMPLVLPVITNAGVTQQVSLLVSLELPYGKRDEIKYLEPRIADAYIQDLYGALSSGFAMTATDVLDVQALKERLTMVTAKVLGPEAVRQVLLQVVQQRGL
jgi:hypothetical protein